MEYLCGHLTPDKQSNVQYQAEDHTETPAPAKFCLSPAVWTSGDLPWCVWFLWLLYTGLRPIARVFYTEHKAVETILDEIDFPRYVINFSVVSCTITCLYQFCQFTGKTLSSSKQDMCSYKRFKQEFLWKAAVPFWHCWDFKSDRDTVSELWTLINVINCFSFILRN